jgi:amino acid transporter
MHGKCSVNRNLKFIVDIPALVINGLITWLCYVGVKESKNFNNSLVILKLAVIVLVILVGFLTSIQITGRQ